MVTAAMTKTGYKKTEIGVIPDDWQVKKLGDIALLKRGKFTPRPRNNPIYYGGNIPFVQTGDVTNSNGKILNYTQTLNEKGLAVSALFKKGTILMTIAANIGYSGVLQIDMACPDSLVAIDGLENINNIFLNYFLAFKRQELDSLSTSGTQKNLNIELLAPFQISVPPIKSEQDAIAGVLSDTDTLLESLEKLIAKKKAVKQGTMQQLLTGKKRLPGFSVEWGVKKLGEISDITKGQGLSKAKLSLSGKYHCILYGELFTTYSEAISKVDSRTNYKEGRPSKNGDILIPGSTTTTGIDLAKASALLMDNVLLGGDINIIRQLGNSYNPIFLAYCLTHINKYDIAQKTKGITIHHLQGKDLVNLEIKMPNEPEQTVIATVLSDMDAEIESLEQKRDKYTMLKQGMMQQLLTGKIRLYANN